LGRWALYNNTTGADNTAVGLNALLNNSTGSSNIAVGQQALNSNTTGSNNTAIGYQAAYTSFSKSNNTFVGYQAGLSNNQSDNSGFGVGALYSNTTGRYNTAIGQTSLFSNTTASYNTAVGYQALYANTTGAVNVAIGVESSKNITTGSDNTAVGGNTLINNLTGNNNTVVGRYAGEFATGASNTFIGRSAGFAITSGEKNTILGRYNGNAYGLDIRTSSNNIVLSDGDGNPRATYTAYNSQTFWGFQLGTASDPRVYSYTSNGGVSIRNDGLLGAARDGGNVANFNRTGSDGDVVFISQNGTPEGSISVSGTTVSYNGGHLARWSRLLDNGKDTSIVKGTVMANLDEMVEWGDEENEQLNKMAVSSVEGDPNVSGVFVNWDEDDEWNDMNIAMTGDMIIRIAQGTTVQRGDLLMSAGDGTAKPQGDDIVRSKTIAKVTSTHVTRTYDDGSYCVPCVLMAC
jgi:hypothetical protein